MSQLENYLTQISSLGSLISDAATNMEPSARKILTTPEIYGLRQIILTGSGDSFFAAQAVAPVLRAWTGLPVAAMTAMEAARYCDAGVPLRSGAMKGLLVVSISYSGEAARVVEATRRMAALGAITLAVTANPGSRLGTSADRILDSKVADSVPAPGTRSYVASLVALYLLSIRISEVLISMTMDHANTLRGELVDLGKAMDGADGLLGNQAEDIATRWCKFESLDSLGAGPSLASAAYCAAKLVEAAGMHAAWQDLEEFHHLNYFVVESHRTPAIVFASTNSRAWSRANELKAALGQLERPHVYVSDKQIDGVETLVVPTTREWFVPIVQSVPAALLAAHVAHQREIPHYRGHTGLWRGAQGAAFVKDSKIIMASE